MVLQLTDLAFRSQLSCVLCYLPGCREPYRAEFSHAARFPKTSTMAGNLRREMSRRVSGNRGFRSRGFFVSNATLTTKVTDNLTQR